MSGYFSPKMKTFRVSESSEDELPVEEHIEPINISKTTLMLSDSSEQDSDGNQITPIIRKPTKKDRSDAFIASQRALRELQYELPTRKSTININTFLEKKRINRYLHPNK
jgi:hypothetical protein